MKRAELEKLKNEAEKPENEAKEVHKLQWEGKRCEVTYKDSYCANSHSL